jgi:hypothetical protein
MRSGRRSPEERVGSATDIVRVDEIRELHQALRIQEN